MPKIIMHVEHVHDLSPLHIAELLGEEIPTLPPFIHTCGLPSMYIHLTNRRDYIVGKRGLKSLVGRWEGGSAQKGLVETPHSLVPYEFSSPNEAVKRS